jgi:hypothetical protein
VAKVLHHRPEPVRAETRTTPVREEAEAVQTAPAAEPEPRTPPAADGASTQASSRTAAPQKPDRTAPQRPSRTPARPTRRKAFDEAELERTRQRAEQAYADSLDAGNPIGPAALAREFGFSEGWGRKRIKAVDARRAVQARRSLHVVAGPVDR